MKTQFYLLPIFTLLFSANLLAVNKNSNLDNTKIENLAVVKKKSDKTFFQKMTQRVLEKRIERKVLKQKKEKKGNLGALSIMSSLLVFVFFSSQYNTVAILGILFGLIGLILGILGVRKEKKKAMSLIGILLATLLIITGLSILKSGF